LPKKTLEVLVDSGNDYCLQVKRNQGKLFSRLEQTAASEKPLSQHQCQEKNRGRIEHRHTRLYAAAPQWQKHYPGIVCFVVLRRWGYRKNKPTHKARYYEKTHYYILSRSMESAQQAAALIRNHWCIENRLHYLKDVLMNEDHNRIRHEQAAKNVSLLKNMVLNVIKAKGFSSLKDTTGRYAHNIKELYSWLL
jgi:predicted transposase YbfD/YdcC